VKGQYIYHLRSRNKRVGITIVANRIGPDMFAVGLSFCGHKERLYSRKVGRDEYAGPRASEAHTPARVTEGRDLVSRLSGVPPLALRLPSRVALLVDILNELELFSKVPAPSWALGMADKRLADIVHKYDKREKAVEAPHPLTVAQMEKLKATALKGLPKSLSPLELEQLGLFFLKRADQVEKERMDS